MARNNDRDRPKKRAPLRDSGRRGKPKVCVFCRDKVAWIDYKDVNVLRRFLSDRAKIKARRTTGTCTQHQRDVATAIKTARELALLAYTQRTVTDKAGGRGEGRGRGPRPPRYDAMPTPTDAPPGAIAADAQAEEPGEAPDKAAAAKTAEPKLAEVPAP